MGFLNSFLKKKKNQNVADLTNYPNISKMFNEILSGPFAKVTVVPDSHEYMYDGYSMCEYEDNILKLYRSSSSGFGMGRINGRKEIILKNYGLVYDGIEAIDCQLWYNHLVKIYNESKTVCQKNYNMHHKVEELFDYVPSGYNDGIISVEYERKISKTYKATEDEYETFNSYACRIFLIPLGEYVYIKDSIHNNEYNWGDVARRGEWVDYVCSLIDRFEQEKLEKLRIEREMAIRREVPKRKILTNHTPINDSFIFRR